jgi:hypothetical protein
MNNETNNSNNSSNNFHSMEAIIELLEARTGKNVETILEESEENYKKGTTAVLVGFILLGLMILSNISS